MALRTKVNRLEDKVRLDLKTKNKASFFERFLDALHQGMVLCNDEQTRPFDEWVKLREIDKHLSDPDKE